MRIALNVEQLLQSSPGGIGRYSSALATLLPRLFPDDEVVPFAAWHPSGALAALRGTGTGAALRGTGTGAALRGTGAGAALGGAVAVRRLPLPRPLLYEGWHRLGWPPLALGGRVLRGIDVVHAPSVAVPPKGRSALVVTVHDMGAQLFPNAYPPRGRRFHAAGVAAAAQRADLVITVSAAAAAEIAERSAIAPERIRVVPNGVSSVSVTPDARRLALVRLGLADRRYVLWVGSLEPRKGVGTLVSAVAELRRRGRHPDLVLVLAGFPGWLSEGIIGDDDRRALGSGLRQLGAVAEEDLWALYGGAEVCAVPSRHEGFGLPVLEAMSQGAAVVCSDIPVLREVGGTAARYVAVGDASQWADALGELLDDPVSRDRLARAGLDRCRQFTWERTVRATRAVYAEALTSIS